ncbi:MAG: hypothetical protein ACHREM_00400 [Polyangiales bacterium]
MSDQNDIDMTNLLLGGETRPLAKACLTGARVRLKTWRAWRGKSIASLGGGDVGGNGLSCDQIVFVVEGTQVVLCRPETEIEIEERPGAWDEDDAAHGAPPRVPEGEAHSSLAPRVRLKADDSCRGVVVAQITHPIVSPQHPYVCVLIDGTHTVLCLTPAELEIEEVPGAWGPVRAAQPPMPQWTLTEWRLEVEDRWVRCDAQGHWHYRVSPMVGSGGWYWDNGARIHGPFSSCSAAMRAADANARKGCFGVRGEVPASVIASELKEALASQCTLGEWRADAMKWDGDVWERRDERSGVPYYSVANMPHIGGWNWTCGSGPHGPFPSCGAAMRAADADARRRRYDVQGDVPASVLAREPKETQEAAAHAEVRDLGGELWPKSAVEGSMSARAFTERAIDRETLKQLAKWLKGAETNNGRALTHVHVRSLEEDVQFSGSFNRSPHPDVSSFCAHIVTVTLKRASNSNQVVRFEATPYYPRGADEVSGPGWPGTPFTFAIDGRNTTTTADGPSNVQDDAGVGGERRAHESVGAQIDAYRDQKNATERRGRVAKLAADIYARTIAPIIANGDGVPHQRLLDGSFTAARKFVDEEQQRLEAEKKA